MTYPRKHKFYTSYPSQEQIPSHSTHTHIQKNIYFSLHKRSKTNRSKRRRRRAQLIGSRKRARSKEEIQILRAFFVCKWSFSQHSRTYHSKLAHQIPIPHQVGGRQMRTWTWGFGEEPWTPTPPPAAAISTASPPDLTLSPTTLPSSSP